MFNDGYPVANLSWLDRSGASTAVLFSQTTDGLFVPFQFVLAERGVPGQIYYGAGKELTAKLGSTTFDPASPYFTPATQFLGTAISGTGANVMRLVDPSATSATLGLFVEYLMEPVTQYQKDSAGNRLLDTNGNFKPRLNGQTTVTEAGIRIRWFVRQLTSQEDPKNVANATNAVNGESNNIRPIMTFKVPGPGLYGNRQGFSLASTKTTLAALATDLKSVVYRFTPMALATDVSTTAQPVVDRYGSKYADFSFKDRAIYSKTQTNYALKYILGDSYVDSETFDSLLPYDVYVYGANVAHIGTQVLSVSPELSDITDPYMIDLISGQDLDGLYYDHVVIDSTSTTVVNSSTVNYLAGGTDGETTFEKLQELIVDFCEGNDHGEFENVLQHPMTHMSDPGFSIATKMALFNLLGLRPNFKLDIATQDVSQEPNTAAEDMSAAQVLATRAAMYPESTINGVGCCRVGIYAHAAELVNGTPYTGVMPFTLARLTQRRNLDSGQYIRGSSGGQPGSIVDIFKKPNWTADKNSLRQSFWASATNVVMHANMNQIFYPSLRTVYPNDTSLLSDDEVSDRVIYIIKLVYRIWAKYAGVRKDITDLFPQIEKEITDVCAIAMNGDNVQVKPTLFQTANDANLGYAYSCNLAISGNMPVRQINFDIELTRSAA